MKNSTCEIIHNDKGASENLRMFQPPICRWDPVSVMRVHLCPVANFVDTDWMRKNHFCWMDIDRIRNWVNGQYLGSRILFYKIGNVSGVSRKFFPHYIWIVVPKLILFTMTKWLAGADTLLAASAFFWTFGFPWNSGARPFNIWTPLTPLMGSWSERAT